MSEAVEKEFSLLLQEQGVRRGREHIFPDGA